MPCQLEKIIIAVDGFSSCGKSTFAREISVRIGYIFIDTGAMYRAVTLYGLRQGFIGAGEFHAPALVDALKDVEISFCFNPQRQASDILLNGENVEEDIRTIRVSESVSRVSQIPEVREKLVTLQQKMGKQKGVVMDGRDIGTVVFPEAELKVFMTASMDVRVQRRYDELKAKGLNATREEVRRNIEDRDQADQTRAISPLRKAPDAILLDNSYMTLEEEMEWVLEKINRLTGCNYS